MLRKVIQRPSAAAQQRADPRAFATVNYSANAGSYCSRSSDG